MRRVTLIAIPLLALALTGCPRRPSEGRCQSDKDCAAQQGYGKVCVEGRCQECAKDADCPAGFACRDLKCVPRAECDETRPCPAGQTCQGGRCITAPTGPATGDVQPAPAPEPAPARCELRPVLFDFNEATLRGDARDTLASNADCLKQMRPRRVVLAGHADERGTNEYNQHLGQRRAESVRRYLVNLGVDGGNVEAVSYGEEQPVCTESSEACWTQNRRVELKAQ